MQENNDFQLVEEFEALWKTRKEFSSNPCLLKNYLDRIRTVGKAKNSIVSDEILDRLKQEDELGRASVKKELFEENDEGEPMTGNKYAVVALLLIKVVKIHCMSIDSYLKQV